MFLVKLKVCELLVSVGRYSVRQSAGLNLLLVFCDITKQILTVMDVVSINTEKLCPSVV